MSSPIHDDHCPLCSTEVVNIELLIRASRRDRKTGERLGDARKLESWCPSCEIYLARWIEGKTNSGWKTSFVKEESLTGSIDDGDLDKLLAGMEWETDQKEALEKFLSMKKEQDRFFKYTIQDEHYVVHGLVLKRDQYLIGDFRYRVEEL